MPAKDQKDYQRRWLKARRSEWLSANGPCGRCGSWDQLEVDHINPEGKLTHRVWSMKTEDRERELAKCQVLCKICHKKKSSRECRELFSGKPNIKARRITDAQITSVLDLINGGLSKRGACRQVGIKYSTFSTLDRSRAKGWFLSGRGS